MPVTPFYRALGITFGPILDGPFRLRVTGLENLPEGGFVLAANHTSNFDPWPLGYPIYPQRQLRFMAKAELFKPILAPMLRAGGAFPIRRGQADREAIDVAVELARQGEAVAVFPEGTRRSKGIRKKYVARPRTGAARIALEADVPLVPAAIKGTERLSRLGPLRVAYGRPVDLDDLRGPDVRGAAQTATDRLFAAIHELEDGL